MNKTMSNKIIALILAFSMALSGISWADTEIFHNNLQPQPSVFNQSIESMALITVKILLEIMPQDIFTKDNILNFFPIYGDTKARITIDPRNRKDQEVKVQFRIGNKSVNVIVNLEDNTVKLEKDTEIAAVESINVGQDKRVLYLGKGKEPAREIQLPEIPAFKDETSITDYISKLWLIPVLLFTTGFSFDGGLTLARFFSSPAGWTLITVVSVIMINQIWEYIDRRKDFNAFYETLIEKLRSNNMNEEAIKRVTKRIVGRIAKVLIMARDSREQKQWMAPILEDLEINSSNKGIMVREMRKLVAGQEVERRRNIGKILVTRRNFLLGSIGAGIMAFITRKVIIPVKELPKRISFYFASHSIASDIMEVKPFIIDGIKKAKNAWYEPIYVGEWVDNLNLGNRIFEQLTRYWSASSRSKEDPEAYHNRIRAIISEMAKTPDLVREYEDTYVGRKKKLERDYRKGIFSGPVTIKRQFSEYSKAEFGLWEDISKAGGRLIFEEMGLENTLIGEYKRVMRSLAFENLTLYGDLEDFIFLYREHMVLDAEFDKNREEKYKDRIKSIFDEYKADNPWVFVHIGGKHNLMAGDYTGSTYKVNQWATDKMGKYSRLGSSRIDVGSMSDEAVRRYAFVILLSDFIFQANSREDYVDKTIIIQEILKGIPIDELDRMMMDAVSRSYNPNLSGSNRLNLVIFREDIKTRLKEKIADDNVRKRFEKLFSSSMNMNKPAPGVTPVALAAILSKTVNGDEDVDKDKADVNFPGMETLEDKALTLYELLFSILLNKKMILLFEDNIANPSEGRPFGRFLDLVNSMKKDEKYKVLLNRLSTDTFDRETAVDKLLLHARDVNKEIFVFTKEDTRSVIKSFESAQNVHLGYIDDKTFSGDAYYPLPEIVLIRLAQYLFPSILQEGMNQVINSNISGGSVTLSDINIQSIVKEGNVLIFNLLPDAERLDRQDLVRKYAAFSRAMKAV